MKLIHTSIMAIIVICVAVSWHFMQYKPEIIKHYSNHPSAINSKLHEVKYNNGKTWLLDADSSKFFNLQHKLQLSGNVTLTQPAAPPRQETIIRTDHAIIFTDKKQLATNALVTADQGKNHAQGIGATVNEASGIVKLLSKIKSKFITTSKDSHNKDSTTITNITSNKLTYKSKTHEAIYTGNVIATQQNSKLTGDKMTIYINPNTNQISKVITTGSPAKYEYVNSTANNTIRSHAKNITYTPSNHLVNLKGNAYINRDGNQIEAQNIIYNQLTGSAKSFGSNSKHQPTYITVAPQSR